jgi:hypothetical protein
MSFKANFGNDPAKPFKYDIEKCPGMVFEWIWLQRDWRFNLDLQIANNKTTIFDRSQAYD